MCCQACLSVSLTLSPCCHADLECCLNLTCHLVPRIPLPAAVGAAQRLAAALASAVDARADKRLLALVTLYNAAADVDSKAAVLLEALSYARKAGLADIMLPVIRAHADAWPEELQLGAGGERTLYTACAGAGAGSPGCCQLSCVLLLLLLLRVTGHAAPRGLLLRTTSGSCSAAAQDGRWLPAAAASWRRLLWCCGALPGRAIVQFAAEHGSSFAHCHLRPRRDAGGVHTQAAHRGA